ncbi:MAG: DMT family transporter [Candidatus Thiosymbion ectosymbiont of Robbea hypermnestra]|nr:DMT family transporter [Candidatus Thiosymbion ectosymbiont of Robbea hypermnestra]
MDIPWIGVSAALGSAASWAAGSILFKRLSERISSPAMTWVKSIVSVVLIGIALVFLGYEEMGWHITALLIGSGLLGIALGDTFFFEALRYLGAHAVVVLLMLGQVLTVVLAVLFLDERPTPQMWFGIALVLCGVTIVLYARMSDDEGSSHTRWRGVLFGFLAIFCMSISIILAKQALEAVSAMQATFVRMLAGNLGMLVFGMGTQQLKSWTQPFSDSRLATEFIFAVVVVTFGGFWLSLVAIKYTDVYIANTLIATEPLFVLPMALFFLKERITSWAWIGSVIVVFGIVLLVNG